MVLVRGGITVKPHVQRAANEVVEEFGAGLSPGTYNGHSPPEGPTQALDLFNPETQAGWQLQGRVADYLIKHAKRLGVRYVIKWEDGHDWIWNIERAAEGWRAMATRDHRGHVHVTFYARAEVQPEPTPAPSTRKKSGMEITYITDKQDYVFSSSARYHGVLPIGETLDELKDRKALDNWGVKNAEFHRGMKEFALRAGFKQSYE